jgi:hypothetical protein
MYPVVKIPLKEGLPFFLLFRKTAILKNGRKIT